jgi:hypothetical protein
MIYITFERGGPKFSNTTTRAHSHAAVAVESQMATMYYTAQDFLCLYLTGGSNVRLDIVHNDKLHKLCLLCILWSHLGGNKWTVCSICGSREKFIKIVVGKYKGRKPLGRWAQMQG